MYAPYQQPKAEVRSRTVTTVLVRARASPDAMGSRKITQGISSRSFEW